MYFREAPRAGLGGWNDFPCPAGQWRTTDPVTGLRTCEPDPDLVMQHCVLTKPGELPGSATQDPNCPAGFELLETSAEDFAPGGVFATGGGILARLDEWEVGPDGWLVHHPPEEERPLDEGDAPTVELGLEYDATPLHLALAALAAGVLFFIPAKRARR